MLCGCVLFCSLLLSSIHHSRWCAAPHARCLCGAQWLLDIYTVSVASGRLTLQKASGTRCAPTSAPAIRGKPLHHRTLQLSNSWAENTTVRRAARVLPPLHPGQDTRPSSERLKFLCSHPIAASIWSNRRNRVRKDENSQFGTVKKRVSGSSCQTTDASVLMFRNRVGRMLGLRRCDGIFGESLRDPEGKRCWEDVGDTC